jgi:hypothetical protein
MREGKNEERESGGSKLGGIAANREQSIGPGPTVIEHIVPFQSVHNQRYPLFFSARLGENP